MPHRAISLPGGCHGASPQVFFFSFKVPPWAAEVVPVAPNPRLLYSNGCNYLREEEREASMATEEDPYQPRTTKDHSFDELSRAMANGSISRGRALRLMGAAIAAAFLTSVPRVASAQARRRCGTETCEPAEVCLRPGKGQKPRCECPADAPVVCDPQTSVQACCPEHLPTCCPQSTPNTSIRGCCAADEVCCPGGSAQACCPVGTTCTSTGCEAVGNTCPDVSCCCVCGFEDDVTGDFIYVCNAANTNITAEECEQTCQSATPPPGTTFRTVGHACEDPSTGFVRVCRPVTGPNFSGTVCEADPCTPPPS